MERMTKRLWLEEQHPETLRWAILDDDGTSAWLYLTEADSQKPVADCFVYNRIPAIPDSEVKAYVSRGVQPPVSLSYASQFAHLSEPSEHTISLSWSENGKSAIVAIDGHEWAMLSVGESRGYSRSLSVEGPFGYPWSKKRD